MRLARYGLTYCAGFISAVGVAEVTGVNARLRALRGQGVVQLKTLTTAYEYLAGARPYVRSAMIRSVASNRSPLVGPETHARIVAFNAVNEAMADILPWVEEHR